MLPVLALALAADPSPAVSPSPVVSEATAPRYRIAAGKGTATLLLNATTGSPEASLGLLTLDAGAEVAPHVHAESVEILYLEAGSVEVVVAGLTLTARAGDAVRIPAGVEHSARVTTTMRALQVYVAAGPEQRFTAGERVNP